MFWNKFNVCTGVHYFFRLVTHLKPWFTYVIEGKIVSRLKWSEVKQKLLWVSRRFEFNTEGKIIVNVWRKSRGNQLWFELVQGSSSRWFEFTGSQLPILSIFRKCKIIQPTFNILWITHNYLLSFLGTVTILHQNFVRLVVAPLNLWQVMHSISSHSFLSSQVLYSVALLYINRSLLMKVFPFFGIICRSFVTSQFLDGWTD